MKDANPKKQHPILCIIKKELCRFLTDKRMLISLLLPGVLIYVMYSLLGTAIFSSLSGEKSWSVEVVQPSAIVELMKESKLPDGKTPAFEVTEIGAYDETVAERIADGELDLCIVFPSNFDNLSTERPSETPSVQIYYNSAESASSMAHTSVVAFLEAYEDTMVNLFNINADLNERYDLADEEDMTAMIFSMLMPMLLVMFLFVGCMAVAPESIAGEKERGTIATLLITPMRRSHLALGKIVGIVIISILSGLSSFIGVMLSLPKLMGDELAISGNVYGVPDYLMILAVMLSTVFLFVAMISVLSAYARSIKEASALVTPLMIIVVVLGITGMLEGSSQGGIWLYLVPLYNSVQALTAIFSFAAAPSVILVTAVSNVAYTVLLVILLTKMFSSERVMFNR